jgi:glutamate-1-semialdehyde 2,1-aminomutase
MALTEKQRSTAANLDELIHEQEQILIERRPKSAALLERARNSLAGGVTSNWQIARPHTIWVSHGVGSKMYDVDGHEYVDFHGGYGVMAVGHAHPDVVAAVSDRIRRGSHFAQPVEDSIAVAQELAKRFGLPKWRFGNSGTEATMDAVHLMRAATGRDLIIKVEGTYHGHHDSVQVSVYQEPPEIGPADRPVGVPGSTGIPRAIVELVRIVPFNDLAAVVRVFDDNPGQIAGMILEPIMMNAGIIPPDDGYLAGLRKITHRHGALLTFDEVKTGVTTSPGGATALFGVKPDLVCLAKAMGGGLPCGAIGGVEKYMAMIASGEYEQVGTFNGNPLTMAAARAALTKVLTPEAYERIRALQEGLVGECTRAIDEYGLAAHIQAFGAKGCIVFSSTRIHNYREFLEIDDRFSHLHWLIQLNNGVFLPPWGKAEQWLLSAQHNEGDTSKFIDNFRLFARTVQEANGVDGSPKGEV